MPKGCREDGSGQRSIISIICSQQRLRCALLVVVFASLFSPGAPQSDDGYFTIPIRSLRDSGSETSLRVQLATNDEERKTGLMYRTSLPPGTGMLFLYEQPHKRGLWMKNCDVKLDAGWFTGDGVLSQVVTLEPEDLVPKFSERSDIPMALETDQGFFASHGLQPGDVRLDLTAVRQALLGREIDPSKFGFLAEPLEPSSSSPSSVAAPEVDPAASPADTVENLLPPGGLLTGAAPTVDLAVMSAAPPLPPSSSSELALSTPPTQADAAASAANNAELVSPGGLLTGAARLLAGVRAPPIDPAVMSPSELGLSTPPTQALDHVDEDPPLQFATTPTMLSTEDAVQTNASPVEEVARQPAISGDAAPGIDLMLSHWEDQRPNSGEVRSAANTLNFLAPDPVIDSVARNASSLLSRGRGLLSAIPGSDTVVQSSEVAAEPDPFEVVAQEAKASEAWARLRVGPSFAH